MGFVGSTSFVSTQSGGLLQDVLPNAAPANNIQNHLRRRHGAHANYQTARMAQKQVQEVEISDEVKSFQLLQPYFSKLKNRMPGTFTLLRRDKECRLLRTFVMLKPMITAFRSCLPVLSMDACHMTNSFKGVLMSASMMVDGEKQTQLLAWGTAPIENFKHWDWFACCLREALRRDHKEQK